MQAATGAKVVADSSASNHRQGTNSFVKFVSQKLFQTVRLSRFRLTESLAEKKQVTSHVKSGEQRYKSTARAAEVMSIVMGECRAKQARKIAS